MRNEAIAKLEILLEQPHFLVVSKPAGLFTQAAAGIDCVQARLIDMLAQRDSHPGKPFIGLPHRLDRETSGALLVARNQRALKRFGEQFQSRKISKYYLAVTRGQVPARAESWQDFVRKVPDLPTAEICSSDTEGARPAHLDMQCLATNEEFSLLLIQLHTGRMHQVRIQAASRGWPILGDEHYAQQVDQDASPRGKSVSFMALHSLRIEFRHPQSARLTVATAPLPVTWEALEQSLLKPAKACWRDSSQSNDQPWPTAHSVFHSSQT